jgi:hypothetical protein
MEHSQKGPLTWNGPIPYAGDLDETDLDLDGGQVKLAFSAPMLQNNH